MDIKWFLPFNIHFCKKENYNKPVGIKNVSLSFRMNNLFTLPTLNI